MIAVAAPASGQVVTGILGFLVVAGMAVALFFLLRSMNKQLRKVARGPRWREEAQLDRDPARLDRDPARLGREPDQEKEPSQNGSPQS